MARRKYEQGGGVVPTEWKQGAPSSVNEFGVVLMERWSLAWNWSDKPGVTASLHAFKWHSGEGIWRRCADDAPATGRCVRWMRASGSRSAELSLTLENWPHA